MQAGLDWGEEFPALRCDGKLASAIVGGGTRAASSEEQQKMFPVLHCERCREALVPPAAVHLREHATVGYRCSSRSSPHLFVPSSRRDFGGVLRCVVACTEHIHTGCGTPTTCHIVH